MDPWHFVKTLGMWASHRWFFFIKLFLKSIFTWLNSMWRCARPLVRGHAVRCCRRPYWALANMFKHWTYDFHWFSSLRCTSTEIPHSFWRTLACPSKLLWKSFKALKSPKIPAGECMQYTECLNFTKSQCSILFSCQAIVCYFVQKLADKSWTWLDRTTPSPKKSKEAFSAGWVWALPPPEAKPYRNKLLTTMRKVTNNIFQHD